MKKNISIVLTIMMLIASFTILSGCGEKNRFIGNWSATIDMTDMIHEIFSDEPEMEEYVKFDDFEVTMLLTFNEDGTYKMALDEEAFHTSLEELKKSFKDGMKDYVIAMTKEQGIEVSTEDMNDMLDGLISEAFDEETMRQAFSGAESEGKYEYKDGKLYTTDKDSKIDKNVYETYEFVSDSELRLLESVGEDEEVMDGIYPMTLKKK